MGLKENFRETHHKPDGPTMNSCLYSYHLPVSTGLIRLLNEFCPSLTLLLLAHFGVSFHLWASYSTSNYVYIFLSVLNCSNYDRQFTWENSSTNTKQLHPWEKKTFTSWLGFWDYRLLCFNRIESCHLRKKKYIYIYPNN